MKLNSVEEILTWFYGENQILKNSLKSNEITEEQFRYRLAHALEKASKGIKELK
jgi:hypothetical protein